MSQPPADAPASPGTGTTAWAATGITAATLAVIAASIAFGTTGTAQAKGPAGTTPLGVGATRILVGAVGLVIAVAVLRRRSTAGRLDGGAGWAPRRQHALVVVAGGAGVALYQPAFFAGTDRSGVAIGTIVALGSGPAFVGIYETVVLRRRPSPVWLAATSLALAGGAILVASQAGDAGRFDGVGVLCSLAAGAGYAVYATAAKSLVEREIDSSVAMAWIFTAGALMLTPALGTEPLGWLRTASGVVMVAHLGLVTVTVAYLLYGFGLRTLATSTAVTLTLAEPVTAALAGVVVLDERLAAAGWAGAAMVVAGLALTGLRRRARAPEPAPL